MQAPWYEVSTVIWNLPVYLWKKQGKCNTYVIVSFLNVFFNIITSTFKTFYALHVWKMSLLIAVKTNTLTTNSLIRLSIRSGWLAGVERKIDHIINICVCRMFILLILVWFRGLIAAPFSLDPSKGQRSKSVRSSLTSLRQPSLSKSEKWRHIFQVSDSLSYFHIPRF